MIALVDDDRVMVMLGGRRASYVALGNGDPLVCIPGGPGLAGSTLGNLGGLDDAWSLIRPDWRGAGISDAPPDGRHGVSDYVGDLELLREVLGLERMTLVSHSFGSLVAVSYAATHRDRVVRLVLDGIPDWRDKQRIAGLSLPAHFARWDQASEFAAELRANWYWTAINWFLEHEWSAVDPTLDMSRVTAPTLVVTGEHDVTFGPECAALLASNCPHATVAVLPGAGHFTWFEQPAAYARLVRDFLDRVV